MTRPESEDRTVAVIGASQDRNKFGNKCVRAYSHAGWTVYPVNPHADQVEGFQAFPHLAAVPKSVDRICIYVPPAVTRGLLEHLPHGTEIYFNPGSADAEVLRRARSGGLDVYDACAIVAIGLSPSQFPE
jgi:predicted CoA-binding protein